MRKARLVVLDSEVEARLKEQARARSLPARLVERSRIVLLAAQGKPDLEIASLVGVSAKTVARWRAVFWN